jgi:hypothetical protein
MQVFCLLCGCKGTVMSDAPLLSARDAVFPLASGTEIAAQRLDDRNVWQREDGSARVVVVDGAYKIVDPGASVPSADSFLVRQTGKGEFFVQASNGHEWAYGLIVRGDMYYLFTFNRADQNCTTLSPEERTMFHTIVKEDSCYVADLRDLVGLLRYMRKKFPNPTSAFKAPPGAD